MLKGDIEMKTSSELPVEHRAALQSFADRRGKGWRDELCSLWSSGRDCHLHDSGLLRQIRNGYGPSWLWDVCDIEPRTTYWNVSISYGDRHSSMSCSAEGLSGAMSELHRNACYYHGIGYGVVVGELRECCRACQSVGTVASKRGPKFKRVSCKACKGRGVLSVVGPIEMCVMDSTIVSDTCMEGAAS